jgi:hypothetical protein
MLAVNAIDYLHSSAKYYYTQKQGIYTVLNFLELNDMEWVGKNSGIKTKPLFRVPCGRHGREKNINISCFGGTSGILDFSCSPNVLKSQIKQYLLALVIKSAFFL